MLTRLLQRTHLMVLNTVQNTALAFGGSKQVKGCMLVRATHSLLCYIIPTCNGYSTIWYIVSMVKEMQM